MKIVFLSSLLFTFSIFLSAQEAVNFQTYTSMKDVTAVSASKDGFWASSSGGAFFYDASQKTFQTLTRSRGLTGTSLTALAIDNQNKIWFGDIEGTIDVYDPADNSLESIFDIANSDKTLKQINELISTGDTIIASTDFGISLIDAKNLVFLDTYFKLGSFTSNLKVNSASKYGVIYACTDNGIAVQKKGAANLSAPQSWENYTVLDGLPSNRATKIIKYNGLIVAATSSGLASFNGTSWDDYLTQFNNQSISDLLVNGNTLYVLASNKIYSYSGETINQIYDSSVDLEKLSYSQSMGLIAASENGVIVINSNTPVFPNGPFVNQFTGLAVDNNGVLWAASGSDETGRGFYKYNDGIWTNYNKSNTPILPTNSYFMVFTAPDNTIYVGNWGYGFLTITDSEFKVFGIQNTGMSGIQRDPNFLVVTGFGFDSQNNLWVLNYGAADERPVSVISKEGTWHHFPIPAMSGLYVEQNFGLIIDQYDTKWFYSIDGTRPGLYFFNENKTFENTEDDISGYLNSSSGLNSSSISSILLDKRGDIWVGTAQGVNIISSNNTILSGEPQLRISSIFTLRQQAINCMAVDPLNRKWIGTNQGLLLVNSDGSNLITVLDSKNSPLPSEIIRVITVDENNGRVYVGTDRALTSFDTKALKPVDAFSELFIYPNPFILNGESNSITIDGLIRDSDIKILSIAGKLIKEFSSPGGRVAQWDGTDMNGNFVSSGVYLIVAFDQEGSSTITGKVAVIRK